MKNLIRSKEEQIRKQEDEIPKKSFTWAVLLTDTHRFYKQQPVQSVICGPVIQVQIQFNSIQFYCVEFECF